MSHRRISSNDNLAMPQGLSADGKKAYKIIMSFLERKGLTDTGGCRAFYSPEEWEDRGEPYGRGAVLIVVYDGGDLYYVFSYQAEAWKLNEEMMTELKKGGFWFEEGTSWNGAVYKD